MTSPEAAEHWAVSGIPSNPPAWLYTVARNGAICRLRRQAAADRRLAAAAPELIASYDYEDETMVIEESEVGDERLRLLLLCCHPALDRDAQVALTLRLVGGLTTPEIAAAFLLPEPTLAQRIVRAKKKIRLAGIPLSIPAELGDRVDALLTVLYLIFNEGYLSRSGETVERVDLADEAIRLTRQAVSDELGDLVLLEQQDRTRWDLETITEANSLLSRALGRMQLGVYQLQAMIAAQHVALNRAVAVAIADGPRAGLNLLESIQGIEGYYLLHSTRGELLLRSGEPQLARAAFEQAKALTSNVAEQRHLDRRAAATG